MTLSLSARATATGALAATVLLAVASAAAAADGPEKFAPWNLKRISTTTWPDNPNPVPQDGDVYKYDNSTGQDITANIAEDPSGNA
ncbi:MULTISPECIES: hypothetical protein [unclassified Streptomyces]|uniref:hypothetical protein n=1 Tax=unclassified Streptomyces TaxID=2593676 RepID=UPI00364C7E41